MKKNTIFNIKWNGRILLWKNIKQAFFKAWIAHSMKIERISYWIEKEKIVSMKTTYTFLCKFRLYGKMKIHMRGKFTTIKIFTIRHLTKHLKETKFANKISYIVFSSSSYLVANSGWFVQIMCILRNKKYTIKWWIYLV